MGYSHFRPRVISLMVPRRYRWQFMAESGILLCRFSVACLVLLFGMQCMASAVHVPPFSHFPPYLYTIPYSTAPLGLDWLSGGVSQGRGPDREFAMQEAQSISVSFYEKTEGDCPPGQREGEHCFQSPILGGTVTGRRCLVHRSATLARELRDP